MNERRGPFSPLVLATVLVLLFHRSVVAETASDTRSSESATATVSETTSNTTSKTSWGVVERVLDGDSIVLRDGRTVRYLGINAPEVGDPFSEEAREFNRKLVEGKRVRLRTDGTSKDRYGRLLAYVHLEEEFVNGRLVRTGLAHVLLFHPLAEEATLLALEAEARRRKRGMWSASGLVGPVKITAPRKFRGRPGSPPTLRSVTVCNTSGSELSLSGFTLASETTFYRFPSGHLRPGQVALVLTRKGKNRNAGSQALRFHWPEAGASNRWPTVLILRAPDGTIVDRVRFVTRGAA